MIAHRLDGDITQLVDHVVWMPAHLTSAGIGNRYKSNNKAISCIDFRGNRLVDKLALHSAAQSPEAKWGEVVVSSTKVAAKHALVSLGRVTFAATNHKVEAVGEDGVLRLKTVRDSQAAPERKPKAKKKDTAAPTVVETFTADEVNRLLEKVAGLCRDQKRFGRRRQGAKRTHAAPTASTRSLQASRSSSTTSQ